MEVLIYIFLKIFLIYIYNKMMKNNLCGLRGPNSKYCKRWCLLRCDTKVKKNNVLAKNGSNMSTRMRYAYNIRGNLKSTGRTIG
jgi:hypothetical protein